MTRIAGLVLLVFLTGACGSSKSDRQPIYGQVNDDVIELYRVADPAGGMEFEFDREGRIYEAEADVHPSKIPAEIMTIAKSRAGQGALVTGAEIEFGATGKSYEIKLQRGETSLEYVINPAGEVLEQERSIERAEVPPGIVEAALEILPGALVGVEVIERHDGRIVYHVKSKEGEARYKAVVGSDGFVLRAVREARCEIEIPLRR